MRARLIAVALALCAPALAQERSSPLPDHLPLGEEVCFSRAYDADEVRAHPRQRVMSFTLLRSFASDPMSEETPRAPQELKEMDGENGTVDVTAMVQLRGGEGRVLSNTLYCRRDKSGVRCGVECDGGAITLRPEKNGLLVLNHGFVVVGGCGDDADKPVFLTPEPDDRAFRLEKRPVDTCIAVRDMQRPAWAKLGPPLRVRLATDEAVCFSRTYDANHLARHPQQTVRRIAVLKPQGKQDDSLREFTFRIELKNGRKFEKKTSCYASKYAFSCTRNPGFDSAQDFFLTRAGDEQIMLRDAKGKLAELFKTRLGSDDRTFRLGRTPPSACDFQ
jgi:hypothetical protein